MLFMKLMSGDVEEAEEPPDLEAESVSQAALTAPPMVEVVEEISEPEPVLETFEVTAYTLHPSETGKGPSHPAYGITASGKRVERGDAACPPSMAFGTKIHIPEMGRMFVCSDRGGAIKGNRLDLYMTSRSSAFEFGRKRLDVEIIN